VVVVMRSILPVVPEITSSGMPTGDVRKRMM
jgi:hypothetical protein